MTTASTTTRATTAIPTLADFVRTVPAPLTTVLVRLAPLITAIRYTAETLSWRTSWYDSWLAVALWWAICLLWIPAIRYGIVPIAIALLLAASRWKLFTRRSPSPVTEHCIQDAITDLITIHSLLPSLPVSAANHVATIPSFTLFRIILSVYPPYLFLTRLITIPTLLGILGTLLLTHRAPWARTILKVLWSSAHIRWSLYTIYSYTSGTTIPALLSPVTPSALSDSHTEPADPVRFLFILYENQRWWVGLDWSAALLPAERPSWCSAPPALAPVAPPQVFTLPEEKSVVMPDGRSGMVRRTASWSWEDHEWRVAVRKDTSQVEKEGGDHGSPSKTSPKTKRRMSLSLLPELDKDNPKEESGETEKAEEEPFTDADGWVYGDNKWEHRSNKSGIGKFTRYRRWIRIAILTELVEALPQPSAPASPSDSLTHVNNPTLAKPQPTDAVPDRVNVLRDVGRKGDGADGEDTLRRRLRSALDNQQ